MAIEGLACDPALRSLFSVGFDEQYRHNMNGVLASKNNKDHKHLRSGTIVASFQFQFEIHNKGCSFRRQMTIVSLNHLRFRFEQV